MSGSMIAFLVTVSVLFFWLGIYFGVRWGIEIGEKHLKQLEREVEGMMNRLHEDEPNL